MKDKIFKFIGEVVYILAKGLALITIMIVITIIVFEKQKEEIWLEAVESFEMLYDTKMRELHENLGIVSEDQEWGYDSYEVSSEPPVDVPDIMTEAASVCIDKLMEAKQVIGPKEMKQIMDCVNEQIVSAQIVMEQYIDYIESLTNDSPSKPILQKIMVDCHIKNTDDKFMVDHTKTLKCIREEVERLNKMLDEGLQKHKYEIGI